MDDMNARVCYVQIGSMVEKWGVSGVNRNGEYLSSMYVERGLFLVNTFFSTI